jgi:hypothetical protein
MESSPVMDNFKNPIQSYLANNYEVLNLNLLKRSVQIFKTVSVYNDKGWLFENVEKLQYISNDIILKDFALKEEFEDDSLYTHLLYFGKKREKFNRSYLKVQELFANIGGFAKLLMMAINFFGVILRSVSVSKNLHILQLFEFFEDKENKASTLSDSYKLENIKKCIENKNNKNSDLILKNNYIDDNDKEKFSFAKKIDMMNTKANKAVKLNKNQAESFDENKSYKNYEIKNINNNSSRIDICYSNIDANLLNEAIPPNKNANENAILTKKDDLRKIQHNIISKNYIDNCDNKNNFKAEKSENKISEFEGHQELMAESHNNFSFITKYKKEYHSIKNTNNIFNSGSNNVNNLDKEVPQSNYLKNQNKRTISNAFESKNKINIAYDKNSRIESQIINEENLPYKIFDNNISNKIKEKYSNQLIIDLLINPKKSKINLSVIGFTIYKIRQFCCFNRKCVKVRKSSENSSNLFLKEIDNNLPNMSNLANYNIKDYCDKNEKEIKDLNIKEKATKNNSEMRKKSTGVVKKFKIHNSLTSKKNKIYKNYNIYEMNLNQYFDVFNYLNVIRDMKNLKDILLEKNEKLLDLIKPKLEFKAKELVFKDFAFLNENPNALHKIENNDRNSNFIFDNLMRILKEQYKI